MVGVGAADHLDLHSVPSADSPILAAIPPDAVNLELTGEVQVDPAGNIWAPVEYQGQTGWVERANLARQTGVPQPGLANAAMQAIQDLKRQDFPKLAALVHPERGLRFSPYAFARPEDQVFNANEVYSRPGGFEAVFLGDPGWLGRGYRAELSGLLPALYIRCRFFPP